jgi:hypothetical protein
MASQLTFMIHDVSNVTDNIVIAFLNALHLAKHELCFENMQAFTLFSSCHLRNMLLL